MFAHFGRGAPDDDQEGEERFTDTYGAEDGDDRVHEAVGAAPVHPGPFVDVDAFAGQGGHVKRAVRKPSAQHLRHALLHENVVGPVIGGTVPVEDQ